MILPIVAYGDPVLRKVAEPITAEYPDLKEFIENMFDTMYNSNGVGLAAPQVGRAIRVFVVDTAPFSEDEDLTENEQDELKHFKKVFINPKLLEESGEEWCFSEGCLSIPGINEEIARKEHIKISYLDENFNEHIDTFSGLAARVIQHEYDHLEGVLFTDKISSLKKRILQGRLTDISKGKVSVHYRMYFPDDKKR